MWDLPGPGFEPVFPALAGGFLTTAPPGKSLELSLEVGLHQVEQGRKWYHVGTAWVRAWSHENASPLQGPRKTPCGTYACLSIWDKNEAGGVEEPDVHSHTAASSGEGAMGRPMAKAAPFVQEPRGASWMPACLPEPLGHTHTQLLASAEWKAAMVVLGGAPFS